VRRREVEQPERLARLGHLQRPDDLVVAQQQRRGVAGADPGELAGVEVEPAEDGGDEALAAVLVAQRLVDGQRLLLQRQPGARALR
jgi:hypothetical protein